MARPEILAAIYAEYKLFVKKLAKPSNMDKPSNTHAKNSPPSPDGFHRLLSPYTSAHAINTRAKLIPTLHTTWPSIASSDKTTCHVIPLHPTL
jgi:hypothetical protein